MCVCATEKVIKGGEKGVCLCKKKRKKKGGRQSGLQWIACEIIIINNDDNDKKINKMN